MDPAAAALAGEPRKTPGAAAAAPAAAAWLAAPKPHDDTPEPGSPASLRALLIAIGESIDKPAGTPENRALLAAIDNLFSPEDRERRKEPAP
jgi:hypothetical protein